MTNQNLQPPLPQPRSPRRSFQRPRTQGYMTPDARQETTGIRHHRTPPRTFDHDRNSWRPPSPLSPASTRPTHPPRSATPLHDLNLTKATFSEIWAATMPRPTTAAHKTLRPTTASNAPSDTAEIEPPQKARRLLVLSAAHSVCAPLRDRRLPLAEAWMWTPPTAPMPPVVVDGRNGVTLRVLAEAIAEGRMGAVRSVAVPAPHHPKYAHLREACRRRGVELRAAPARHRMLPAAAASAAAAQKSRAPPGDVRGEESGISMRSRGGGSRFLESAAVPC